MLHTMLGRGSERPDRCVRVFAGSRVAVKVVDPDCSSCNSQRVESHVKERKAWRQVGGRSNLFGSGRTGFVCRVEPSHQVGVLSGNPCRALVRVALQRLPRITARAAAIRAIAQR